MLFVVDAESKTKGKAAVDVIGNPLGKSGGSFIQQVMLVAVLCVLVVFSTVLWHFVMYTVRSIFISCVCATFTIGEQTQID